MGGSAGRRRELLLVPVADANCVMLPGESGDEHEDDFVLIADVWVTGWHATELAGVRPAGMVAVFGAGAIGLLAAYSAQLRGASEVYSVDLADERLDEAGEMGFVPVDARQGDSVEQITGSAGPARRPCRRISTCSPGNVVRQGRNGSDSGAPMISGTPPTCVTSSSAGAPGQPGRHLPRGTDQAPDMSDRFDRRVDRIVKVVFNH